MSRQHFKFILNQYFQAEVGGMLNVKRIMESRDDAAKEILAILKQLEHDTGMRVSYLSTESATDFNGDPTGVGAVEIGLELPG